CDMRRGRSDEHTGCNSGKKHKAAQESSPDSAWTANHGPVSLSLLYDLRVITHGANGRIALSASVRSSADYIRWLYYCYYHIGGTYRHQPDLWAGYRSGNNDHCDPGGLLTGSVPISHWPVPAHRPDSGADGTGLCGSELIVCHVQPPEADQFL